MPIHFEVGISVSGDENIVCHQRHFFWRDNYSLVVAHAFSVRNFFKSSTPVIAAFITAFFSSFVSRNLSGLASRFDLSRWYSTPEEVARADKLKRSVAFISAKLLKFFIKKKKFFLNSFL